MTKTKQLPTLVQARNGLRPFLAPKSFRPVPSHPHLLRSVSSRDGEEWQEHKKSVPLCEITFHHGCMYHTTTAGTATRECMVTSITITTDHGVNKRRNVTIPAPARGFDWVKVGAKIETAIRAAKEVHDKVRTDLERRAEVTKEFQRRKKSMNAALVKRGMLPNYESYSRGHDDQDNEPAMGFDINTTNATLTLHFQHLTDAQAAKMLDAFKKITK